MKTTTKFKLATLILTTPLTSYCAEENLTNLALTKLCNHLEIAKINGDNFQINRLTQEIYLRGLTAETCNPRNILRELSKSGNLSQERIKQLESAIELYEVSKQKNEEIQKRYQIALDEEERLERECARIDCRNTSNRSNRDNRESEKLKSEIKKLQVQLNALKIDAAKESELAKRNFDYYDLRKICKDSGLTGRCR